MTLQERIAAAVARRDARIAKAQQTHGELVAGLHADFEVEQRRLAESFMGREQESLAALLDEERSATADMDADIAAAAEEQMAASLTVATVPVAPVELAVDPAAAAAKYTVAELKAFAKARGLAITGSEQVIIDRLIADGWKG